MSARNQFKDPRTGSVYVWQENHREEQGGAVVRAVTAEQPTIGRWRTVRSIRQQGSSDLTIFKLAGTVPTRAQHDAFLYYLELSIAQTIYFIHAAGGIFECQLSDYEPLRKYVVRGPHGENYIWDYTMQIDVIAVLG